jgi:hypothetical protein
VEPLSWVLKWNFDKPNYAPGETAVVSFRAENLGQTPIYVTDISLEFDFGTYMLRDVVSGFIMPRQDKYLGSVRIVLPKNVVGRRFFTIRYRVYEYFNGSWVDLGYYSSDKRYFISIYPRPLYKVFVSRSIREEDKWITDAIVEMIKEWGFETITVGVEVKVPEEKVADAVREEIKKADALIAIVTPRFLDALTGLWRTLEWLHGEVGISYGYDKPLLILKDKRVALGGLPKYLAEYKYVPLVEFDPFNLEELKLKLHAIMPGFREWIANKKREEFFEALATLAVGAFAVIGFIAVVSGIVGALFGSSKK